MGIGSSGAALLDILEISRYRTLEARCRRADVEVWRNRALKHGRDAVGVATSRSAGMEVWRLAVDVDIWSARALEGRCRRSDVEV